METLIEELSRELNISAKEAIEIMKTIAEYVENQHPLLNDIAQDILDKEIVKIKNT